MLHDVSFSIDPGELVALVGGSGAGKSTLLDAIAGVRPADEGTVLYDGIDYYRNLAAYRSSLGYVPQEDIIHRGCRSPRRFAIRPECAHRLIRRVRKWRVQ